MSIYKRPDRPQYRWGHLRVSGKLFRKSLETTNKQEAGNLLFEWKNQLLGEHELT